LVVLGGDDALRYAGVPGSRLHNTHPNCYAPVDRDGQRYLLADLAGNLYMLLLELGKDQEQDENSAMYVRDMKVESLGETCIAECMCYLDNGVCFIGSRFGDSQLIRLSTEPRADGTGYISLLDSYTNLAPIRDMTVMRCNGQQQILTCSGAYKDGTIRIIRNGIGIEELASVELKGIKNMFTLRTRDDEFDDYLILSFDSETHVLLINGEELEDTEITGFTVDGATLWAGCLFHSKTILQVTHGEVILIDGDNIQVWKSSKWITLVAVNEITGQLVVACGALLIYLEANSAGFKVITEIECEFEISCIDITPIGKGTLRSEICAVGYWTDLSVALRALPQLVEVVREKIVGDMLSRSIMLSPMEGHVYLLVALGDGTVHYFQIDMKTGALLDPKKATLGTQPIHLRKFRSRCSPVHNIFVCSDRPAVIYSSNQKLLFSNVNLRMVSTMTPLYAEAYPDALVLTDGHSLVIVKYFFGNFYFDFLSLFVCCCFFFSF
uniref:MMS1_N domain-containing protein n=1 Tax=Brugia timori TaxID=42155 RepID=A0A0R3R4U4_9BILA